MHKDQPSKISIVGSAGVPAQYGGFETLAEQLCRNLYKQYEFLVFCSKKNQYSNEPEINWNYSRRRFINLSANGFSSVLYDLISLINATQYSKTILILGCSAGIFLPIFKVVFPSISLLYHPDGLEWKRSKWNYLIKSYLYISNSLACMAANKIIIDNNKLLDRYNSFKDKISTIAYGGDQINGKPTTNQRNAWLVIARSCPENQIHTICDTFINLPEVNLIIVSDVKGNRYGRKLYNIYKEYSNILFTGPIYNKEKLFELLSSCNGYIHPHTTGGTNPSLTTAMWFKKPILCFDNPFNRETTDNTCYYFKDKKSLLSLLKQSDLKVNPETYLKAQNDYTWKAISEKYSFLFKTS